MHNIKGHSSFLYITFKNKTYGGSGRSGLLVFKKSKVIPHLPAPSDDAGDYCSGIRDLCWVLKATDYLQGQSYQSEIVKSLEGS